MEENIQHTHEEIEQYNPDNDKTVNEYFSGEQNENFMDKVYNFVNTSDSKQLDEINLINI